MNDLIDPTGQELIEYPAITQFDGRHEFAAAWVLGEAFFGYLAGDTIDSVTIYPSTAVEGALNPDAPLIHMMMRVVAGYCTVVFMDEDLHEYDLPNLTPIVESVRRERLGLRAHDDPFVDLAAAYCREFPFPEIFLVEDVTQDGQILLDMLQSAVWTVYDLLEQDPIAENVFNLFEHVLDGALSRNEYVNGLRDVDVCARIFQTRASWSDRYRMVQ